MAFSDVKAFNSSFGIVAYLKTQSLMKKNLMVGKLLSIWIFIENVFPCVNCFLNFCTLTELVTRQFFFYVEYLGHFISMHQHSSSSCIHSIYIYQCRQYFTCCIWWRVSAHIKAIEPRVLSGKDKFIPAD